MVRSDGLVVMQDDSRGRTLALNPDLYTTPTDTFAMIAVVPRTICVLAVAVLWVLSPIDLIPDSLPGIGMLDDTVVTLLSGAVVSNLFVWLKAWKRKGPTDAKGYLNNV
ncbi:MAG: DUF1232 domain-containing protein [Verrucomicrobia bacterium]|nr:DUF1232 domain-containing protein [Verrucomicrobiota bacterium]